MRRRKFIATLSGVTALLAVGPSVLAGREEKEKCAFNTELLRKRLSELNDETGSMANYNFHTIEVEGRTWHFKKLPIFDQKNVTIPDKSRVVWNVPEKLGR